MLTSLSTLLLVEALYLIGQNHLGMTTQYPIRIFILYTVYIVWEGAESYMGVEENVKLKFVGIVSAVILLAPIIIDFLLSMLMPGLRFE